MMPSNTLAVPAEYLLDVKRSRFLARAVAVESAAQALAWLDSVRVADAIDTEKHILHQFRRTLEIISARGRTVYV